MDTIAKIQAQVDDFNTQAQHIITTDPERANTLSDLALALAISIKPRYERGYAHARAVQIDYHAQHGDYPVVTRLATELEGLYAYLPPDRWLCNSYFHLGWAYYSTGHFALALESHQKQLALAQQLGLADLEASALRRIGVVHKIQHHDNLVLHYLARSLAIYQRIGDVAGEASIHNNMALQHADEGRLDEALQAAHIALALYEDTRNPDGQNTVHGSLAEIYLHADQFDPANHHADAALALAAASTRVENKIKSRCLKAEVLLHRPDPAAALPYLTEALALTEDSHSRTDRVTCLKLMSRAHAALGEFEPALGYHQQYCDLQLDLANTAAEMRFEQLEVLHQTQQAHAEAHAQRHLREEERRTYEHLSQMKDDLLSTTSHDLKNPLATLHMMVYLLRAQLGEVDESVEHVLASMERNIDLMRTLVADMLDLARLQTGVGLVTVHKDLVSFVQRIIDEFEGQAAAKGLSLRFETDAPVQFVEFDPKRMHQVLSNLLTNAMKYTPSGSISVQVSHSDSVVRLGVMDTGLGIPAPDLPHIFERFYRVHDERHAAIEGTGLGLSICQSIIEQHQGRIWVESTLGKGSQFTIELPLRQSQTAPL